MGDVRRLWSGRWPGFPRKGSVDEPSGSGLGHGETCEVMAGPHQAAALWGVCQLTPVGGCRGFSRTASEETTSLEIKAFLDSICVLICMLTGGRGIVNSFLPETHASVLLLPHHPLPSQSQLTGYDSGFAKFGQ